MTLKYIYFGFAILGIFLFFFLLKKFFRWLQTKLDSLDRNVLFKKKELLNIFKFITPRREKHILKFSVRALRIAISIFFLVVYLPFVFSFIYLFFAFFCIQKGFLILCCLQNANISRVAARGF